MTEQSTILGNGIYTFTEAARLTRLKKARVREWFVGAPTRASAKPVFLGDYRPIGRDRALSFHDLIELFVAGRLREHGVSLQKLRWVHERMKISLKTDHPFCKRRILTDGLTVFTHVACKDGYEELIDVLANQRVFPRILLPFLRSIEYDKAQLARKWHITQIIAIDPMICFGKPVVDNVSIPTSVLAASYDANHKDAGLVARWYGIEPRHVKAAVEFEATYAA